MRLRTWLVAGLLFGSGLCALVYQVGWLRDFRLIFGASTAASAAVLAIFIGGLGLGGLLLGPRADRHPRPLLFYALLESIVAVSAAMTPVLLTVVRAIYIASGGSARLGGTFATIARLVLSAVVLAVPTIAMGGTLPAAARAVTGAADVRRRDVATLYAFNTLGAVAGCLVATFWLLEVFGTRSTLWLAAAVNLLVAIAARLVDESFGPDAPSSQLPAPSPPHPARRTPHAAPSTQPAAPRTQHPAPSTSTQHPGFVLIASAVVGFAFFLMELVWYRLLAPLLGGSVFTFGLVLAMALAGIGIGGLLYALVAGDKPATPSGFALSCLIEAAAVAGTYALGDRVALLALVLQPLRSVGFGAHIAGWTIITALVVLPPALVAGYQFPLLIALLGRGRERLGRQIGLTYTANTLGAIVGALAGGFGVLPWLSAPGAWRLVAAVLVLLGVVSMIVAVMNGTSDSGPSRLNRFVQPDVLLQTSLAVVTIALIASTGPTAVWRHSGVGAGRAASDILTSPNRLRAWSNAERRAVVWEGDGTESAVALALDTSGYSFIINGKADGSARGDSGTQVMLGLLGAVVPAHPRRALVIGLGTGSSAGWLAAIPEMERVDVIELEPLVLDVARACRLVNHDAMNNPKIHVTIGDARETLLTTHERYDVIASEPSNPFRAGIASLFTVEYYRAASDRLTDDGAFAQWVQGYEIDTRTLGTIYATMSAVFPQVETWQTQRGDLGLVGSKRRHTYRAGALAARIAEEPFKTALANTWRAVDLNGFFAHYLANDALTRALATGPNVAVNTDDRNIVEFGLARSVGRAASIIVPDVRRLAQTLKAARPPLDDAARLDWAAVDTAWVNYNLVDGSFDGLKGPDEEQARQAAVLQYYRNNDLTSARASWEGQREPPRDPTELTMLANIEAETGSDGALALINRLRTYQPGEADVILAKLRLRQSKPQEAAAALESALARFRVDPWPMLRAKQQAFELFESLAADDPSLARRLFGALGQPFAVRAMEDVRLITLAELSTGMNGRAACRDAVGALEPHVPWTSRFLLLRRDCYEAAGDPRLARAVRDLNEFAAGEAQLLSTLVSAAAR